MRLAFFVSGGLGFKAMREVCKTKRPEFIATDRGSEQIIEFAGAENIKLFTGNPRKGRLKHFLEGRSFDLALSMNYLFILENDCLEYFSHAVNFHGSLLPKYRGRTPHVWAIINNESETGVTAHLIDEGCDTGKIVSQVRVSIGPKATGADILKQFEEIYPVLALEIIQKTENGDLNGQVQDESRASYFGKRTPEDGCINWEWNRERIKNWVRAQAFPYPGAFTYYGNKKITIDEISFSDHGFHFEVSNGTILHFEQNGKPVVKTSNGCVLLDRIRESDVSFRINSKLHD